MADATIDQAFEAIYKQDAWSHGSGPGSRSVNTIEYRAFLERFIEANGVTSVTDLGCGDWQFSRQIDWSGVTYTGFDIVESIVMANRVRHARPNIAFKLFSSIDDLPGGDLLLCKEVLQHLPTQIVLDYIEAIRGKYRFALLTNSTEPRDLANIDIEPGGYRPLRLDQPPLKVPGAKVFTYHSQGGSYFWKNVVFLVMGVEPPR
jgi:2-polyprenyl-3-methyl-5-hydroxy-6-metoxy-1,4-benzoquinol methylase